MGGVPVKHHSKSKVGRRRSQLGLKKQALVACSNCRAPILPHKACLFCKQYSKAKKKTAEQSK